MGVRASLPSHLSTWTLYYTCTRHLCPQSCALPALRNPKEAAYCPSAYTQDVGEGRGTLVPETGPGRSGSPRAQNPFLLRDRA